MTQNIIDPELLKLIRKTIMMGSLSVYTDLDGEYREYAVPLADDKLMILSRALIVSNESEAVYEYGLTIGGQPIASTAISSKQKIVPPSDQIILELFSMCAKQIIAQEMRALFHNHSDRTRVS